MSRFIFVLVFVWGACISLDAANSSEVQDGAPEVVFFDMTPLYKLDLKAPSQLKRFWDEMHCVVSLQGLVNRDKPRMFIRWIKEPDDFWWHEMTQSGGWLAGHRVLRLDTLSALLDHFRPFVKGAVVWDENVPSTSNLASTIAGCEDLLCLRNDAAPDSLYRQITQGERRLPVKARLLRDDGSVLFTGKGTIPGTLILSSGSAKCDAYLWLVEHYLKTGKINPRRMGYYMDGFWLRSWNAAAPENHTLSNHDYVIAHKGLLFDLGVWDDEPAVDDPNQKPGTDVATLKAILRAAYDRFQGKGMIHVAGFVPWAFKYTNHKGARWSAGGRHDPVPTEWRYAEILSCFNAYMDADALGLGAMANSSFFQHYPLKKVYPQNPKPTLETLQQRGLMDRQGKIVPRHFVAHYVGDYDAAAWLYRELPKMWRDPARGSTPLSWAFNPNLSERFPLGMAWARERRSTNDFFVAGDSGAGYLNPGYLVPPRQHSGLPGGLDAWEQHCSAFFKQWDISITGFVIDGYAPGLNKEGLDAYSRFSPDGIVPQQISRQGLHNNMPWVKMRADIDGTPQNAAKQIASFAQGRIPGFTVARSILKTPSWYAAIERELQSLPGNPVQIVDLYTLMRLVKEYELHRERYANTAGARLTSVHATPTASEALHAVFVDDGPLNISQRDGSPCWIVAGRRYLYFDIDEAFVAKGGTSLEIAVEYWDSGKGAIQLHYDSTDSKATVQGAYKASANAGERKNAGQWATAIYPCPDARAEGRQNAEADFRLYNGGDELFVRSVRVKKATGTK